MTPKLPSGEYVRIAGPSILQGQEAVVILDLGEEIYCAVASPFKGSQRLIRAAVPREDVALYQTPPETQARLDDLRAREYVEDA